MSARVPPRLRDLTWAKSTGLCGICRRPIDKASGWEADHIIPWALGGPTVIENLQASHPLCNKRKGDTLIALPPGPARRAIGRTYAIAARLGALGVTLIPLPLQFGPRVSTLRFVLPRGAVQLTRKLDAEVRAAVQTADRIMRAEPVHGRARISVDGNLLVVQLPRSTFRPVYAADLPAPDGLTFSLGADMNGRPVLASIGHGSAPHWLIAGATNAGKSEAMLLLAYQALRGGALVACADVDGWGTFAPLASAAGHFIAPTEGAEGATASILAVCAEMHRRKPGDDHRPLILLVDELHMLGRAAMKALGEIALGGRKRRVHLVMSSHYPKADQVARMTTTQVGHRLCLRVEDAVASRTIIEREGAEMLLGKGHGLYRHGGLVTCLQVALVTPNDCARLPQAEGAAPTPEPVVSPRPRRAKIDAMIEEARKLVAEGKLMYRGRVSKNAIREHFGIWADTAAEIRDAVALPS